jgi:steroid delta-isomerase-like uncharacterized protein
VGPATANVSPGIEQAYQRYIAAWGTRDVDAILALHAHETQYWYRAGQAPVIGREAVRAAFADIFRRLPDFEFDVHRVLFGQGHWVLDWALKISTPGLAGRAVRVRIDCVDVVNVDAAGLVTRKDTYVDAGHAKAAIRRVATAKLLHALTGWWPGRPAHA